MAASTDPTSMGSDQNPPPISSAEFQALVEMIGEDMPEVVVEILDTYVEESTELVQTICDAEEANDTETMLRPAHSLKSSSASIGAMHLSRLSADLESHLRGSLPDLDVPGQVAAIEQEFIRVRDAVAYEKSELLNT